MSYHCYSLYVAYTTYIYPTSLHVSYTTSLHVSYTTSLHVSYTTSLHVSYTTSLHVFFTTSTSPYYNILSLLPNILSYLSYTYPTRILHYSSILDSPISPSPYTYHILSPLFHDYPRSKNYDRRWHHNRSFDVAAGQLLVLRNHKAYCAIINNRCTRIAAREKRCRYRSQRHIRA